MEDELWREVDEMAAVPVIKPYRDLHHEFNAAMLYDHKYRKQPPQRPIPVTEVEFIALYRALNNKLLGPENVLIGDALTMTSGITYVVSLPPVGVRYD